MRMKSLHRSTARATALVLLVMAAACDRTPPQRASLDDAIATPSGAATAPPAHVVSPAEAALAVAVASEEASRAAREQTLSVQRHLVEAQRATRDAARRGSGNERCLSGQRMRRVANGWVQAGAC